MPELMHFQPVRRYMETQSGLQSIEAQNRAMQQGQERHDMTMKSGQMGLELSGIERAARLRQMQEDLYRDIAAGAAYADTPEKWNQVVDHFSQTIPEAEQFRDKFDMREMFIKLADPNSRPGALQNLTSSMKDYYEWQRLQSIGDPGADAFGKRAGFISREGDDLSAYVEKRLGTANDEAIMSANDARNYAGLADEFAALDVSGGATSKWSERYKEFTGAEDAISALRQQYRQIRNSEVIKNLPPGVASDKDIEIAMSGFPPDTADPQYIAQFLRGLSKLAKLRADYADFRARYMSEKGHERGMLEAWKQRSNAESGASKNQTPSTGKYQVGQVIDVNGRRYRVTGGDPNDPDVELVE